MATELPNFFSTNEAADIIGITGSLVRRYIRKGKLKARQVGERSYVISKKDLYDFKKQPRKPGKPKAQ